jgi:hypothetical protein
VQNKSKRTLYGIVCLILFACYLLGSVIFIYSFDSSGNIEIELLIEAASQQPTKQTPERDSQETPHKHIVLSHLYSLQHSETEISLIHPITSAFIQPQTLSIQFSENLPNAHLLLSHQKFPHQILVPTFHTRA